MLILARAARAGASKPGLQALLGAQGAARLQRVLIGRAGAWARAVAPGRVHVAVAPASSGVEVAALVGGADVFEQRGDGPGERLAQASSHALEHWGGPLLVIGTAMPSLSSIHARSALADLTAGCDVSLGPTTGGSCYLLALGTPQEALRHLDRPGGKPMPLLARALAASEGLHLGLLRSERELATEADARALLADPCCPGAVREALRSCALPP